MWKELEHEVLRDASNNALSICNMESLGPMGIHMGESIVTASSQKLTNSEYYRPKAYADPVVRHLGVGDECNIQPTAGAQSQ